MCDDTVRNENSYQLQCVPDWFVKQKRVNIWYGDNDCCNDYEIVKLYNGNKNANPKNRNKRRVVNSWEFHENARVGDDRR